jgi:hypothetical protein
MKGFYGVLEKEEFILNETFKNILILSIEKKTFFLLIIQFYEKTREVSFY